jgi:predicted nucleic acid-binding protein
LKYLVLDASTAIGWMVDTPPPPMAVRTRRLLETGTIGVVPDLWYYEVCNALMMAERRRRASAQIVSSHVSDVERLSAFLETSPTTPSALIAAARQSGLTAYDAAYFELALRRSLPLVTLDHKLRAAAQKAGIAVLR